MKWTLRQLVYEALNKCIALECGVALSHCPIADPDQRKVLLEAKEFLLQALDYKLDEQKQETK